MPINESLTAKVSKSATALIARHVVVAIINIAGGILLARLLTPVEFGIFAIITFTFEFLIVFGDVGLAASLIRKPGEPTVEEYRSVFTIQQLLVAVAGTIFFLISPVIVAQYELAEAYLWLFRIVALAMLPISLMAIPKVQLERNLDFEKIAVIEVCQSLTFYAVAVVLAFKGFGAFALGWGFLARTVVGSIFANIIQPWKISFHFDWEIIKKHLKFGIPYQANSLLGAVNKALNPILIGLILGMVSAGYVEWAILVVGYLQKPIYLLNSLLYSTFSKLRDNLKKLNRSVNYAYVVSSLVFFSAAGVMLGLAPQITVIAYTAKWLPALPLLYLLIVSKFLTPAVMPNSALAYSLGWANTLLYLEIFRIVFLWAAVFVFLQITESFMAYGYAMLLNEFFHLILYFMLKNKLPGISILKTQGLFVISAVLTALTIFLLTDIFLIQGWFFLIIAVIAGIIISLFYTYTLYFLYNKFTEGNIIESALIFCFNNFKQVVVKKYL